MSTRTSVTVEGLADLDAALGEFSKATAKNILRRVLTQAAQPIDEAWREKAPHLTGALEQSGAVGTKLSRRQAGLARQEDGRAFVEVYVGPGPLPQAIQEEFGNSHQAAHPFMRPAWEENKDRALSIIGTGLTFEISAAADRARRKAARLIAKNGG